jgi:UPF0755 protein
VLRRLTALSLVVLAGLLAGSAALYWWVNLELDRPLAVDGGSRVLVVQPGDTLSGLARRLATEGAITSRWPVLIQARLTGKTAIQTGEYRVPDGQSLRRFLERLRRGDVIQYRITFPEGTTVKQWLELMAAHPALETGDLDKEKLAARLGLPADRSPEGLFFPDTYIFTGTDSAVTILRQAHERMSRVLDTEWPRRRRGLPLESPYEALILASIVEKETAVPAERDRIAGVFIRRLERGMRLQTDPTVIYGLGERYAGNLKKQHLREETPYNTYRIRGLPPTPIANPGRESIRAVLNPAPGEALYFVARGDGSHYFSRSLEEHNRAVRRFQIQRREDYRSSPNPPDTE